MEAEAGQAYTDKLTDEERLYRLNDPRSELFKKHANATRVIKAQNQIQEENDKRITAVTRDLHVSGNDLKDASVFFGKDKKKNAALSRIWLNRDRDPKKMISECLTAFVQNSFDDLDLSTDEKLSKNAYRMERLSAQYDVVMHILEDHRETYDLLPNEARRMVQRKIGQANGLINYYRMMRTVITNTYYITHENRELSLKGDKTDTPAQKRLMRQLWLAKGGLKSLTDFGVKKLDQSLEELCGSMQASVVSEEQLKLQETLAERDEDIEKNGFAKHLNNLEEQGDLEAFYEKVNKGVFNRARYGIKMLKLPQKVDKAFDSVPNILDQLQFIKSLTKEKLSHKNYYYLEHNYRDIAVMDQVESLGAPLKAMKEAILSIANVNSRGFLKSGKIIGAVLKEAQQKYESAMLEYLAGMGKIADLNTTRLMPKQDPDMVTLVKEADQARTSLKNPAEDITEEQKKLVREKLKDMMLILSGSKFSDYSIYKNAKEIMKLMKEKRAVLGNDDEYYNFDYI